MTAFRLCRRRASCQRASPCLIYSGHSQVSARPRHRSLLPPWFGAGGVRRRTPRWLHRAGVPLSPTIEDAERRMAVLLRRMRAHLRDPYDFTVSRIADEAGFEECLDRAAALGTQIAELGGAPPASQAERERTRGLILEGLMTSHRTAAAGGVELVAARRAMGAARGRRLTCSWRIMAASAVTAIPAQRPLSLGRPHPVARHWPPRPIE